MRLIRSIVRFFDRKIILPVTKFFVNIGKKIKKINKPLESLLKTKSSLIVVSLLLAMVIFLIVDSKSTTLLETDAEVLYNQKVTANYNDEEYVVTGLPKTVDITMIGTKANLYLAKQLPEQPVTVDLSNLSPGVHEVKLKYKQAITSVEYKLDPSTVTVSIDTKQSITREISSEIVNLDNLDSKYSVSSVKLDSNNVIIKGSEAKLKEVATVKALINISKIVDVKVGDNVLNDVELVAYNENGKKINVELVPKKLNATVKIESPNKTVPLKIKPTGVDKIAFGKAISSIKSNVDQVTIYGNEEVLNEIDAITVNIDVSNLKSNKKYTKTIKKPKGIREISSKTVTAEISIDDEASTEVSGVRLSYINLGSNYTVQATESSTTEIPVTLKGVKSVIENITATDIEAYLDLKDLGVGEHEVDVKVKGNDPKVNYSPRITKVKIQIADKQ